MTTSELDSLFNRCLAGDYESKDAWDAVAALRTNGSREIYDRAAAWCLSDDPQKRRRAADVLCQLQRGPAPKTEFLFRDESYMLLSHLLQNEQDLNVVGSAIYALGHLHNESAIPVVFPYRNHLERNIRRAVSFALGSFPNDPRSIEALLELAADPEADIRDWSVFSLGVLGDADSPEIRETLLRCLTDSDEEVREEAAVGLGRRRDKRVIPALQHMLQQSGLKVRLVDAAVALLGLDEDPPDWTAEDYLAALSKIRD